MSSPQNEKARQLWAALSTTIASPQSAARTLEELRSEFDTWAEDAIEIPAGAQFEHVDADGVPCIWARMPGTSRDRTILYYHGGGYVMGSAAAYSGFGAALSAAADAQVLVVDYRRAPENPHPAAVEDSITAYRWALKHGSAEERTVLAGDSAGGGLNVAVISALRDTGEKLPAAAVCLSPWVDMTLAGESYERNAAVDPIISKALLGGSAKALLAGQDPKQPSVSPLFADLTGLPPTMILIGSAESLYDEAIELATRARHSGVDVTLTVGEDMFHVWPVMSGFLPEAQDSVQEIGRFIQEHTP